MEDTEKKKKTLMYLVKRMCYWVSIGRENAIMDSSLPIVSAVLHGTYDGIRTVRRMSHRLQREIRRRTNHVATGTIGAARDSSNILMGKCGEISATVEGLVRSTLDKLYIPDDTLDPKEVMIREVLNPPNGVGLDSLAVCAGEFQKVLVDGVNRSATTLINTAYADKNDSIVKKIEDANNQVCVRMASAAHAFARSMIGSAADKACDAVFGKFGFKAPKEEKKSAGAFGMAAVLADERGEKAAIPALVREIEKAVNQFVPEYDACRHQAIGNANEHFAMYRQAAQEFYEGKYGFKTVLDQQMDVDNEDCILKKMVQVTSDTCQRLVDAICEIFSKVEVPEDATPEQKMMRGMSRDIMAQRGWFSDAWDSVTSFVSDTVDSVKDTVSNAVDAVSDTVSNVVDAVSDTVGNVVDAVKDTVGNAVDTVKDAGTSLWDKITGAVGDAVDTAKDVGKSWLDKVKDALGMSDDKDDEEDDEPEDDDSSDSTPWWGGNEPDDDEDEEDDRPWWQKMLDPKKDDDEDDDSPWSSSFPFWKPSVMDEDDEEPEDEEEEPEDDWDDDPEAEDWMDEDEPYEDEPEDDEMFGPYDDEDPDSPDEDPYFPDYGNPDDSGDEPDSEDPSLATSTPMTPVDPPDDRGMTLKPNEDKKYGWKTFKAEPPYGIDVIMHDGDQQFLNPYGREDMSWTVYSFRPCDTQEGDFFPQIAITPASFESIKSMKTMLNNIPYVVVKEYFFKNEASTMMNLVQKIMGLSKEAFKKPEPGDDPADTSNEASAQGSENTGEEGNGFIDKVKEKFQNLNLREAAIELPYILYCGLRRKLYGNTYVFPYIVTSGTIINQASNDSEWNEKGGMMQGLKDLFQNAVNLIGDVAAGLLGSQAQTADLFPAPTWSNKNSDKVSFQFDLILINDHVIKTRNNYMCVNTIIHNNRSIQKAILAFPGALYEVWLPTGQRHLMCTGDFKLYPLGLNRQVPDKFFIGDGTADGQGASGDAGSFRIGASNGDVANMENPAEGESPNDPKEQGHRQDIEVVPDAYKLSINFKSCLANNMNTAVFQYYVKMVGYDGYAKGNTGGDSTKSLAAEIEEKYVNLPGKTWKQQEEEEKNKDANDPTAQGAKRGIREQFKRATTDLVDGVETFNESTYNKKLERLRSQFGDKAINADSVVLTIKKSQGVIRESNEFLAKLYNANSNNLWYKDDVRDEIYTTIEPDYRKVLKKQYQQNLATIRSLSARISEQDFKIAEINAKLSRTTNLEKRAPILAERVREAKKLNELTARRDIATDQALAIDTDLIRAAFDQQDSVVSVKKNGMTFKVFEQVWNEKIMNSYEKEKLKYLTSSEKERYFEDKVRELAKYDNHGILNHPDWFFRVVVLDFICSEMNKLINWFKNCSFDDFDTIYKIVRKLNLLHLDVSAIRSDEPFDINKTNLFYLTDEDMKEFTKVDGMLTGNTLYQLFQNQVKLNFVETTSTSQQSNAVTQEKSKELIQEQESEVQTELQKKVRQDVVTRVWGSETELTKAAFQKANESESIEGGIPGISFLDSKDKVQTYYPSSLKELKDRIITLKLIERDKGEESELQALLGAFTNLIGVIKEGLVIQEMNKMSSLASGEIGKKDDSVNAKVM